MNINMKRTLALMRGFPGIGKSTFLRRACAEDYVVCPDDIRLLLSAPTEQMDDDGSSFLGIDQSHNREVWSMVERIVRTRLADGSPTIIDATFIGERSIKPWFAIVQEFGFQFVLLDFIADNGGVEEAYKIASERNRKSRKGTIRYVPQSVIDRMRAAAKKADLSAFAQYTVMPSEAKLVF